MKQAFRKSTSWFLTLVLLFTLVPMTSMQAFAIEKLPTLKIIDGTASFTTSGGAVTIKSGETAQITSGAAVKVKAKDAPSGKEFDKWEVAVSTAAGGTTTASAVTVEDAKKMIESKLSKASGEFMMPHYDVELKAIFKTKAKDSDKDDKDDKKHKNSGSSNKTTNTGKKSDKKADSKDSDDKGKLPPKSKWLYEDVRPDAYYSNAVKRLSEAGVLKGVGNRDFAPYATVNRAMLVTVLYRIDGEPMGYTESFSDVPDGVWYSNPVAWGQTMGVINGYNDSEFAPMDNLTVEQIVTILYRYQMKKGKVTEISTNLSDYAGAENVSDYAKDSMAWGIQMGMVKFSDGNKIMPKANITRADLAVMIDEIIEY